MAKEDYRIQAYKRVADMTTSEGSVENNQDSFTPNVAADLVRASLNNPDSIRGSVNGQVFGNPPPTSEKFDENQPKGNKKKATIGSRWNLQDLFANTLGTALGKIDPATWKTAAQQVANSNQKSVQSQNHPKPNPTSEINQGRAGQGTSSSQSGRTGSSQATSSGTRQATGRSPSSRNSSSGQMVNNQDVMRHGLVKVPVAPLDADGRENIYRRVAKFLLLIGTDEAAKVISHLTPEQTERIIPEIASIRRVDPAEAQVILDEFKTLLDNARQQGGVTTARNILEKAFGSQKADELLSKAVPFPEGVPFDYLQEMDGDRVFLLLKDEPAPVRTLVLSRLRPAVAAEVINQMESEDKKEVIRRLAKLTPMDPEILRRVDRAMHEKVLMMNTHTADSMDGRGALTEILKRMSPNAEKDILSALSDLDPELSNDIRERLFTIDDIVQADDRFLQKKLHSMSEGEIAMLIAGKPESFRQKILTNVSKNRGDVILEEESLRRPMRRKDCDEVTARFFSVLRRAWEDGSLIIHGRSDDIYV